MRKMYCPKCGKEMLPYKMRNGYFNGGHAIEEVVYICKECKVTVKDVVKAMHLAGK